MRKLKGYEQGAAGLALVSTLAAGCGGVAIKSTPDRSSAAPSSSAPSPKFAGPTAPSPSCGTESTAQRTSGSMEYEYKNVDANPELMALQEKIGIAAVRVAVRNPFVIRIGGVACTVQLGIPRDPSARQQSMYFVANSSEASDVFAQLGISGESGTIISTTRYGVTPGPSGVLQEAGPSVSVIGQETDGAGLNQNAATEYCQGLEADDPGTGSPVIYQVVKEAVCNDIGIGADSRQLGMTYSGYVDRLQQAGNTLTGQAAHGLDVQFAPLLPDEYAALPAGN